VTNDGEATLDEIEQARLALGGAPDGWRALQFTAALQVNVGKAMMAAMVLDGARTDDLDPDDAPLYWRRAVASIAAVCWDALQASPEERGG
jgi:hypothetical protein